MDQRYVFVCRSQVVRQNFHEHVSSHLRGLSARSYRRTPGHGPTSAVQDVPAVLHNRHISLPGYVPSALRRHILRGPAQRLLRLARLRLHPTRLRANRAALLSPVGDLQGSPGRGRGSVPGQRGDDRRMREASPVRARARAQDTVVVRVDRDGSIHFQHGHPVHQHFPDVQGRVSPISQRRFLAIRSIRCKNTLQYRLECVFFLFFLFLTDNTSTVTKK